MDGSAIRVPKTLSIENDAVDENKLYYPHGRPLHSSLAKHGFNYGGDPLESNYVNGMGGRTYIIINYTDKPIAVYDNTNYLTIIEPVSPMTADDVANGYKDQIVIRVAYRYSVPSNSDCEYTEYTRRRFKTIGKIDNPIVGKTFIEPPDGHEADWNYYRNRVDNDGSVRVGNSKRVYGTRERQVMNMVLTDVPSLLKNYGGAFYSETFDLVFEDMSSKDGVWVHPRSGESLLAVADRPELSEAPDRLCVEVKINDPETQMRNAFVNISGAVFEVPIFRNNGKPSGITIVRRNDDDPTTREEFYPLTDDSCPFKLFDSRKSAMFDGNLSIMAELDNLKLKNENIKAAHESQMAKYVHEKQQSEIALAQLREKINASAQQAEDLVKAARLEKENAAHAAALAAEQHVRDMEKIKEAERIRDDAVRKNEQLENASFFRKSFIEVTKIVAAAIGAVGMLATIYLKTKKA